MVGKLEIGIELGLTGTELGNILIVIFKYVNIAVIPNTYLASVPEKVKCQIVGGVAEQVEFMGNVAKKLSPSILVDKIHAPCVPHRTST